MEQRDDLGPGHGLPLDTVTNRTLLHRGKILFFPLIYLVAHSKSQFNIPFVACILIQYWL